MVEQSLVKLRSSIFIFMGLILFSCNKQPAVPKYKNVKGYVIAKEVCKINEADDYWLLDLTYLYNTPQYGDTIVLNGRSYNNVVKTKGLDQRLKQVGLAVSLDFETITSDKFQTSGCAVTPITYNLKELFIINQGEIR